MNDFLGWAEGVALVSVVCDDSHHEGERVTLGLLWRDDESGNWYPDGTPAEWRKPPCVKPAIDPAELARHADYTERTFRAWCYPDGVTLRLAFECTCGYRTERVQGLTEQLDAAVSLDVREILLRYL